MQQGEAALAAGRVEQALHLFERAALVEHAADIEMSLVRTYLQAGSYRQAVAFSAHTAGAHRQVPEGAALYAWLLAVGGQQATAIRLLDEAAARFADHPFIGATRRLIADPAGLPASALAAGPARLLPYSAMATTAASARIVASGVLIDQGRRALVPLAALDSLSAAGGARSLAVRTGLGRGSPARLEQRVPALGLAVLRLSTPLQFRALARALGDEGATLSLPAPAERDPFPGSPGYAVGFTPDAAGPSKGQGHHKSTVNDQHGAAPAAPFGAPAWPRLQVGFHGMPVGADGQRALGIDSPPGLRGGPVFDAAGHWAGVALTGPDGSARLLPMSLLTRRFSAWLGTPAAAAPGQKAAVDEVYEGALRTTLQVIVSR